ncbi:unnamed protein product [Agarophyton chilense]
MKTFMKPKEEVRAVHPVATPPTSGTKKRKRLSSFTSPSLKDIYDSSAIPLPVAAAAAAAAAVKSVRGADEQKAVEEMVKAAGQVLHTRSSEGNEERKENSTPVLRKCVTFAEPLQISEAHRPLMNEDLTEPLCTILARDQEEAVSKAFQNTPDQEVDVKDGTNIHQNHPSSSRKVMHNSTPPDNRKRSEGRKAGFQHVFSTSSSLGDCEIELERMSPGDNEKTCIKRQLFACKEEINPQPNVRSIKMNERAELGTFANDGDCRRSEGFNSHPSEEKLSSQIRGSDSATLPKRRRTQPSLELTLSNAFGTNSSLKEAAQFTLKEDSIKSSGTTESDTSDLGNVKRSSRRSHRKPQLSEVLKLQKSLETAYWTDSRLIQRQTEVIVISDSEMEVPRSANNSPSPERNVISTVCKERDKACVKKEPNTRVSTSVKKYNKKQGLVKPLQSLSVQRKRKFDSQCVALRTRSSTAKKTRARFQNDNEGSLSVSQGRSKPKQKSVGKSDKSNTIAEVRGTTENQKRNQEESRAVKMPKSSKRKASVPKQLRAQDFLQETELLASDGTTDVENASGSAKSTFTHPKGVPKLESDVDNIDLESDAENVSPSSTCDPLQDLVKVKLNKKSWESFREGWAVHNDIMDRANPGIESSSAGEYILSPFGCEDLISAFGSDFGLGS